MTRKLNNFLCRTQSPNPGCQDEQAVAETLAHKPKLGLSGRSACQPNAGNASKKPDRCGLQPVAGALEYEHFIDPHPTAVGGDGERTR